MPLGRVCNGRSALARSRSTTTTIWLPHRGSRRIISNYPNKSVIVDANARLTPHDPIAGYVRHTHRRTTIWARYSLRRLRPRSIFARRSALIFTMPELTTISPCCTDAEARWRWRGGCWSVRWRWTRHWLRRRRRWPSSRANGEEPVKQRSCIGAPLS
ncbi:hypothetical protein BIW11_10153 [Tropilaelaps mercedesae]|uniref:Uncharacterized protein n=1 Tax=Tropilaelaps mercedesae TaxID=418985 RepID=A0A1V9XHG0_9ACAR|nr:hypothetical protein BIW11_10153 [Tropilaelaps mercedesae]